MPTRRDAWPVTGPKPSVVEALSAVMGDVQAVGKTGRNTQQNYNFRGVDAVVNAVGPALRAHGVVVVPIQARYEQEHYTTAKGSQMKGVTLTVTFRFYGPAGDFIDAQACGESSDAGDKAMPKAHSVAYRTMLLQALCIPTDESDPDSQSHERAAAPSRAEKLYERLAELAVEADAKREDITDPGVSLAEIEAKLAGARDEDTLTKVGIDVSEWIREGCKQPFTKYEPVRF